MVVSSISCSIIFVLVTILVWEPCVSFQLPTKRSPLLSLGATHGSDDTNLPSFDPLNLGSDWGQPRKIADVDKIKKINDKVMDRSLVASMTSLAGLSLVPKEALAGTPEIKQMFDPGQFQPVCPASDGFYRFLQGSVEAVVGSDGYNEYGPLIAGGLLRVRLELCVVESFFNEAVGPFIQQNGLSWILPLHETVETFLAGTVFALASTFILLGSTKILTVIFTYADFLLGVPFRLFGGFTYDRARGKPVTLDIGFGPFKTRVVGPPDEKEDLDMPSSVLPRSELADMKPAELAVLVVSGGVKATGEAVGFAREVLDAIDLFVGRYLVFWATFYIAIKFLHFKVFPDFPFAG